MHMAGKESLAGDVALPCSGLSLEAGAAAFAQSVRSSENNYMVIICFTAGRAASNGENELE